MSKTRIYRVGCTSSDSGNTLFPEIFSRRVIIHHGSDMIYEFKIISMDNWQLSTTLHHFLPCQRIRWKTFLLLQMMNLQKISIRHLTLFFLQLRNVIIIFFHLETENRTLIASFSAKWSGSFAPPENFIPHVKAFHEIFISPSISLLYAFINAVRKGKGLRWNCWRIKWKDLFGPSI